MNQSDPIPYATSTPNRARVWAASAVLFAGLALIFLGGCFLIGVLDLTVYRSNLFSPTFAPTMQFQFQVILLYTLAGACFVGAVILLVLGLRGLFKIMGS